MDQHALIQAFKTELMKAQVGHGVRTEPRGVILLMPRYAGHAIGQLGQLGQLVCDLLGQRDGAALLVCCLFVRIGCSKHRPQMSV